MRPSCLSPASQIRLAADFQRYSTSDDDSGCVMDEYAWVPSGCKPDMVHSYFSSLPNDKVPYVNSAGEQWRVSQLKRQLPPQDSDPSYCLSLSEAEAQQLLQFEAVRKRQCLGKGVIRPHLPFENQRRYCHQCKQSFGADDMVIEAPERFGNRAFWHPKCFVCVECTELLVDLIYFKHNDNVFCGRHHAEQLKPRCAGCDELIFNEECTEAEGRMWHMKHFACGGCDCQLGGLRYVVKDTRPFCITCYNQLPQPIQCNTCGGEIQANEPRITQGEVHWHTDERCFACIGCAKKLLGSKKYSIIGNGLYCGPNGCERRIRRAKNGENQRNFGPISARIRGVSPDQVVMGGVSPGSARNSGNSSTNGGISPRNGLNTPMFAGKPISPMLTVDPAHLRPPGPPPLRSPPLPPQTSFHQQTPPENIYETVALPETKPRRFRRRVHRPVVTDDSEVEEWDSTSSCSSSNWTHARTHRNRRSLSMDGCTAKLNNVDGCSYDDLALEEMNLKNGRSGRRARPQNFYSGMPPNFGRRSSYTTTSESDSEDEIYMGKYDSVNASLTPRRRPAQRQAHYEKQPLPAPNPTSVRRRAGPKQLNARRIKNKSNSNCIVS